MIFGRKTKKIPTLSSLSGSEDELLIYQPEQLDHTLMKSVTVNKKPQTEDDSSDGDGGDEGSNGAPSPLTDFNIDENDVLLQSLLESVLKGHGKLGQRAMKALVKALGAEAVAKALGHPIISNSAQFTQQDGRDNANVQQNENAEEKLQHRKALTNSKQLQNNHLPTLKPQ